MIALLTSLLVLLPSPRQEEERIAAPVAAAELALEQGCLSDANRHFRRALELAPFDAGLMLRVFGTLEEDEDARILWTHDWCDAAADPQGRVKLAPDARRRLADLEHPLAIAGARAAAAQELAGLCSVRAKAGLRRSEEFLIADWAGRLARELARKSPALEEALDPRLPVGLELPDRFHRSVLEALERLMKDSLAGGRTELGLRAARTLHGLVVQAGFKDLEGPRPSGMKALGRSAAAGLERARKRVAREVGTPWSLEDLEWLSSEEGEAFTREHSSFARPGVALSPNGWYRIETDCGFETLLGVAETVELHHQRLADWFGRDPFVGRPGLVRVVPKSAGLESEGAPFWWAGGFQGGDTTVMRFAQGTIEGLGHGITHELTHRFDGAIYPGIPSWLAEGKAVWTGAAYGAATDREFVVRHVLFGTIEGVYVKGWGSEAKLAELVGGVEDYRENYSAGYALYVYLHTWEVDGAFLYRERLQHFMENARDGARDPRAFFERCFCDGREGRPESLSEFAQGWAGFLKGFHWKSRASWLSRYTGQVPSAGSQPYVYDEPTWTWQPRRCEPFFGQGQALVAARTLLDADWVEEGVHGLVWALACDLREPRCLELLAQALAARPGNSCAEAAWVANHALYFPERPVTEPAPFLRRLVRTRALLAALQEAARDYREAGALRAAAALAADHDRLARWLGAREIGSASGDEALQRHPFDRGARPLSTRGWGESRLVDYDEGRIAGLWYEDGDGDLHVGRRKPRTGSGSYDRSGGGMAFVHGEEYLGPGSYRIRARIQLTTSYVSGAVIFGFLRRDASLRLNFSAGDVMYAIGESEEEPEFEALNWSLQGLWERDGGLAGSTRSGSFDFGQRRTAFDLELVVDGASVRAAIEGVPVASYHTVDGRPIEGRVGFATRSGAIRVERPRIERLERTRLARRAALPPTALDLQAGSAPDFDGLENRPVWGLEPAPNGNLLLWIPMPAPSGKGPAPSSAVARRARSAAGDLARAIERDAPTQPLVIALPAALEESLRESLAAELAALFPQPPLILWHPFDGSPPAGRRDSPDLNKRWLLFVDAAGIVRVAHPFRLAGGGFGARLGHWLTVFRDHGQPERDLPPVRRASEEDPEEDLEEQDARDAGGE